MFSNAAKAFFTLFLATAATAHASTLYFNGFESGTGDWQFSGPGPGTITATPSGGGPLGLTAAQGGFYGTIHNNDDGYLPGYGEGGFSLLGTGGNVTPYPGAYTEQVAVYVNVNTPPPAAGATTPGYWVDTAPSSTDAADPLSQYAGEHNFQVYYNGTSVTVGVDQGSTPIATITQSGWYTFQTVYSDGATPTSISLATLNLIGPDGTVIASESTLNNQEGDTLESQYLAGPGYVWLPSFIDGFSNDELAIDNVASYTVTATPEPASIVMLGSGLLSVAGAIRRRRRS